MSSPQVTPSPQQVDPQQYAEYLKAQVASQANTTGLTQMAPSTSGARPPTTMQNQDKPGPQQNQAFGPGQGGARKRESMQNLVKSVQGVAQQFGQYAEQKQQRQYEQVVTKFTSAISGVQQAQSQVQQGQQMLKQANELLQKNPQDPQAHQLVQQGQQLTQQGQTALKTNNSVLDDMRNDPKQHKVITKAFGVDDKNANSPERKAAASAIQKTMQVSPGTASTMAQLPQTQQLTPQAQSQQQARQAGVVGAPATGGQLLNAETKLSTTATTEEGKDERANARQQLTAAMNGQKYTDDGKLEPMTPEEISKNPVLSAKVGVQTTREDLNKATAELQRMKATALPEQLKLQEAKVSTLQGNLMMRQKEFGIKVQEEERKQLETANKIGAESSLTTPEGGKIELPGGKPLQSWAQQTVVQTQDRIAQVDALMDKLAPMKDNNQAGYLALDRLGYSMGFASPNGELGSEISNIELQRVVNAATILKGSSRAYAALSAAMIHTPNAFTDSPKLMYQKLQTIQSNLKDMQHDAIQYGQKNQHSSEMPGGSKSPPKVAPQTDFQELQGPNGPVKAHVVNGKWVDEKGNPL